MRRVLSKLMLMALLPQVHSQGFCIGESSLCSSQRDCGSCEFFNCKWKLFNDDEGDYCMATHNGWGGGSCSGQSTCKDCEQSGGCKWVATINQPRPPSQGGRCVGDSIFCDGTNCKDCEFWSECRWEIYPGERGDTCRGASITCGSQQNCKDCTDDNWIFPERQCAWVPTCRGSSYKCSSGYNDASCECYPECTWGNHFSAMTKNYTQQCVGSSSWCSNYKDCGSCRASWGCRWARVPKPPGPRSFCDGKPAGWSCDGNWVRECDGLGVERSSRTCGEGLCTGNAGQASCFCDRKPPSSKHCNVNDIVLCPSGQVTGSCPDGKCVGAGSGITCGTLNFCNYRANGTYCDGSYMKECEGYDNSGLAYCGEGACKIAGNNVAECGTLNFCNNRSLGAYCDGKIFKGCNGDSSIPREQKYCKHGCNLENEQAICKEAPDLVLFASGLGCAFVFTLLALHSAIN